MLSMTFLTASVALAGTGLLAFVVSMLVCVAWRNAAMAKTIRVMLLMHPI
jgi:hypothetical protein